MEFKKYSVSNSLRNHIAYFWTLQSELDEANRVYRFIPDGNVDWIFHLSEPWSYRFPLGDNVSRKASAHIFGQFKNYLDLTLPAKKLFMFGVNFHPWAARNIWHFPLHEVTDNSIALSDLNDPKLQVLEETILKLETITERIKYVEAFVLKRIQTDKKASLAPIIEGINENPLCFSYTDFNVKKRRIEQRFKSEVGISPKHFQRTVRINKVIKRLINNPGMALTQLAYEFEYYDQSHFILDFKKFTGCSPSQFLKSIHPSGPIYNFQIV